MARPSQHIRFRPTWNNSKISGEILVKFFFVMLTLKSWIRTDFLFLSPSNEKDREGDRRCSNFEALFQHFKMSITKKNSSRENSRQDKIHVSSAKNWGETVESFGFPCLVIWNFTAPLTTTFSEIDHELFC